MDSVGGIRRCLWTAILVSLHIVSVYLCLSSFNLFYNSTTVTTIESTMASLRDITFPSIYICNTNQVGNGISTVTHKKAFETYYFLNDQVLKSFLASLDIDMLNDNNAMNLLINHFVLGVKPTSNGSDPRTQEDLIVLAGLVNAY